ncbi:hypothetical protein QUF74_01225 [Candidatus Halobeggiatoa sp. HSG11]|nr:hypothetical protein [Candidatus Halobeggiatoa sp. HSG11]
MDDIEFVAWLMFMLIFAVLPIKPIFKFIFKGKNTTPCVEEEVFREERYSQLYRPGDKKYDKIVKLSNNAKIINKL